MIIKKRRRRPDSNRCMKVLQTSPLPLGYGAVWNESNVAEIDAAVHRESHRGCDLTDGLFYDSSLHYMRPCCTTPTTVLSAQTALTSSKNSR